jgi:hypothetical protein
LTAETGAMCRAGQSRPRLEKDSAMDISTNGSARSITAAIVSEEERLTVLPRHFGLHMMIFENSVYLFMRALSTGYTGGFWRFFELSNGGFYMAPEVTELPLRADGNGYEGRMSGDAAGITACLYALSHLSFTVGDERISGHYYRLREFAAQHREAIEIFAAID